MKRKVFPGLLAVLTAASCSGSGQSAPPPELPCDQGGFAKVVEDVAPSVVTVQHGQGVGSGVVYKPDLVLTNQHVVSQNKEVTITYADGKQSQAEVVAGDPVTDVAVLRTERKGLTPARFATDLPRPGCKALAIGSPLGFQFSVTAGVISGLHRSLPVDSQGHVQADLIQTDAPISPGNSGGALVDTQGRVTGINEAYIPPETGAVSLGFAVPAATVTDVGEQLLTRGNVAHAYLGVSVGELTPSIRDRLGVKTGGGALVLGVEPNSPAAAAGLRPGDVITRFGDTAVTNVDDLLRALAARKPGERVTFVVNRDGTERRLDVVLGAQH
jgi:S1-C subfamily serine protease